LRSIEAIKQCLVIKQADSNLSILFRETKLCFKEAVVLDNELEKIFKKGVVTVATHSEGEFISTIFLLPKKTIFWSPVIVQEIILFSSLHR
jgi:hypothetical protein